MKRGKGGQTMEEFFQTASFSTEDDVDVEEMVKADIKRKTIKTFQSTIQESKTDTSFAENFANNNFFGSIEKFTGNRGKRTKKIISPESDDGAVLDSQEQTTEKNELDFTSTRELVNPEEETNPDYESDDDLVKIGTTQLPPNINNESSESFTEENMLPPEFLQKNNKFNNLNKNNGNFNFNEIASNNKPNAEKFKRNLDVYDDNLPQKLDVSANESVNNSGITEEDEYNANSDDEHDWENKLKSSTSTTTNSQNLDNFSKNNLQKITKGLKDDGDDEYDVDDDPDLDVSDGEDLLKSQMKDSVVEIPRVVQKQEAAKPQKAEIKNKNQNPIEKEENKKVTSLSKMLKEEFNISSDSDSENNKIPKKFSEISNKKPQIDEKSNKQAQKIENISNSASNSLESLDLEGSLDSQTNKIEIHESATDDFLNKKNPKIDKNNKKWGVSDDNNNLNPFASASIDNSADFEQQKPKNQEKEAISIQKTEEKDKSEENGKYNSQFEEMELDFDKSDIAVKPASPRKPEAVPKKLGSQKSQEMPKKVEIDKSIEAEIMKPGTKEVVPKNSNENVQKNTNSDSNDFVFEFKSPPKQQEIKESPKQQPEIRQTNQKQQKTPEIPSKPEVEKVQNKQIPNSNQQKKPNFSPIEDKLKQKQSPQVETNIKSSPKDNQTVIGFSNAKNLQSRPKNEILNSLNASNEKKFVSKSNSKPNLLQSTTEDLKVSLANLDLTTDDLNPEENIHQMSNFHAQDTLKNSPKLQKTPKSQSSSQETEYFNGTVTIHPGAAPSNNRNEDDELARTNRILLEAKGQLEQKLEALEAEKAKLFQQMDIARKESEAQKLCRAYEEDNKKLVEENKKLRSEIEKVKISFLENNSKKFLAKKDEKSNAEEELNNELNNMQTQLRNLESENKKLEKELSELSSKHKMEIQSLWQEKTEIEKRLEESEKKKESEQQESEKIQEIEKKMKIHEQKNQKLLDQLRKQLDVYIGNEDEFETKIKDLNNKIKELKKENEELKKKKPSSEVELQQKLKDYEKQVSLLQKKLKNPTTVSTLIRAQKNEQVDSLEKEKTDLEKEMTEKSAELEKKSQALAEREKEIEELKKKSDPAKLVSKKVEETRNFYMKKQKEKDEVIKQLQGQIVQLRKNSNVETNIQTAQNQKKTDEKKTQQGKLSELEKENQELKQKLSDIEKEKQNLLEKQKEEEDFEAEKRKFFESFKLTAPKPEKLEETQNMPKPEQAYQEFKHNIDILKAENEKFLKLNTSLESGLHNSQKMAKELELKLKAEEQSKFTLLNQTKALFTKEIEKYQSFYKLEKEKSEQLFHKNLKLEKQLEEKNIMEQVYSKFHQQTPMHQNNNNNLLLNNPGPNAPTPPPKLNTSFNGAISAKNTEDISNLKEKIGNIEKFLQQKFEEKEQRTISLYEEKLSKKDSEVLKLKNALDTILTDLTTIKKQKQKAK